VFAKKQLAATLRAAWQLSEGAVFDLTYLDKYVDLNRSLLPSGFSAEDFELVRDCRDSSVEVWLPFDATDPRSQSLPKDLDCKPIRDAPLRR
jgi:hypothetical protein